MNHPPPDDYGTIIRQFIPVTGQWELNDDKIGYIDPQFGGTILHNYCLHINSTPLPIFKYLIEVNGVDINARDNCNDTPLYFALRCFGGGDITVLTYLLNVKDANFNFKGQNGDTLLHYACLNINRLPIGIFKLLIETKGCDVNVEDKNKNTPLHFALRDFKPNRGGNINTLTYLLALCGDNINLKGYFGRTLLHRACENINRLPIDIFKYLIDSLGSDINIIDDNKFTPIHFALRDFKLSDDDDDSHQRISILTYLLSHQALNVNIKGRYGYTLLHWACLNINSLPVTIFKCLIETKGGDFSLRDDEINTPLYYALERFKLRYGNIAALNYLLSLDGVDINIKGQNNRTLLHIACFNINQLPIDVLRCLIETQRADINALDWDNNTPIHNALYSFKPDSSDITLLTYLLTQNTINFNIRGRHGYSLLHLACILDLSGGINNLSSGQTILDKKSGETDTFWSQIVEIMAETCLQQVIIVIDGGILFKE
jgi:ankyrin repeat protein